MIAIGEAIIFKVYNKNGEVMMFGKNSPEKRKILRMFPNIKGKQIVEWESKRQKGVCMISTWDEWRDGINENKRRA